jgi:predicted O-linked N-acetylglucosamine transferase (SPINDLY family)
MTAELLTAGDAEALQQRGIVLAQQGRLVEAAAQFRAALQLKPGDAEIQTNLGLALREQGQYADAVASLQAALRSQPNHGRAQALLREALALEAAAKGMACLEQGKLPEAEAHFRQALHHWPEFPEGYNNLGHVLARQGRLEEAIACYQQALRLRPHFGSAYNNLGIVYLRLKRPAEAEASFRAAIRLRPELAAAYTNLGLILLDQERLTEAIDCFERVLRLQPGNVQAHNHLATALHRLGQPEEAVSRLKEALRLQPTFADAHKNLGKVLRDLGRFDEAEASYQNARQLNPDDAGAHLELGNLFKDQGRLDDMIRAYRCALELKPDAAYMHSNLVYALHFHPDYEAPVILEEAQRWNQRHAEPLQPSIQPHTNLADPERQLRIGYVSPDFRNHATTFFTVPLLSNHDHRQFAIYCYAHLRRPDSLTERLQSYADVWRNTLGLSDEQLADLVRRDQIDILVDLTLHMADNRLLVFARKPAPVQVCWLAYQGTTGLSTMDYRLTDHYCDPPGLFDRFYSEESIRLPDAFGCYDPLCTEPAVNPLPARDKGSITFGSFNNFCKLNPAIVKVWAQVLTNVERSQLLILAAEGSHRQSVLKWFEQERVAPERVQFITGRPRRQYLELYHRIDMALDTVPYSGQTTSLDAFWMGVPVLTLVGRTAVGRAGLSLLQNLGLPDWIAETPKQFVAIAVKQAADLPGLAQLRASLRQRLQASPLMDGPRFARNMEAAYRRIWQDWCARRR